MDGWKLDEISNGQNAHFQGRTLSVSRRAPTAYEPIHTDTEGFHMEGLVTMCFQSIDKSLLVCKTFLFHAFRHPSMDQLSNVQNTF